MPSIPRDWVCNQCSEIFTQKFALKRHQARTHASYQTGGPYIRSPQKMLNLGAEVEQIGSGFDETLTFYEIANKVSSIDLITFLESKRQVLIDILDMEIKRKKGLKACMRVHCIMQKPMGDEQSCKFKTKSVGLFEADDLSQYITDSFIKMKVESEETYLKNSGLRFQEVDKFILSVGLYRPLRGGRFMELPEKIKNKNAIINPLNYHDDKCAMWAILSGFAQHNKNRPESLIKFQKRLDFSGLSFPTSFKEFKNFEKKNPGWTINVFALDEKEKVFPVRIVKREQPNHRDLLFLKNGKSCHYCNISDLGALVVKQIIKKGSKLHMCKSCLAHFYKAEKLAIHKEDCNLHKPTKIVMPTLPSSKIPPALLFKNIKHTQTIPFIIYADFECILVKVDAPGDGAAKTKKTQHHQPVMYGLNVVSNLPAEHHGDVPVGYQSYTGADAARHFVDTVEEISYKIATLYYKNNAMLITREQKLAHEAASKCYKCKKSFTETNHKVADHDHVTSHFRGSACNKCNLQLKPPRFVPIVIHNLSGYDSHLIFSELCTNDATITVIPSNTEKFITFSKVLYWKEGWKKGKVATSLRFIDSYKFLSSSLETLAQDLQPALLRETAKHFQGEKFDLAQHKNIFCYDYFDSLSKLSEKKLPSREHFYNKLKETELTEEEYQEAQRAWQVFGCQTFKDYAETYMKIDVLLLSDIFSCFREHSMQNYELDPAWYFSAPSLSWDAALKMTGVELELLTDQDMLLMVEKGIRGGLTTCTHRYETANNPYMPEYIEFDQNGVRRYLLYVDAINLYGAAMCSFLPANSFRWVRFTDLPPMDTWKADFPYGWILECDITYPKELHFNHNDLPFLPESIIPPGGEHPKLCATLYDKTKYVIHYMNLRQCVEAGLVLTKVHRVIQFMQLPWLRPYIMKNTEMRNASTSKHAKAHFKLFNNAVYGKTLEQKRRHIKMSIACSEKQLKKLIAYPDYIDSEVIVPGVIAVRRRITKVVMDKPIPVGFCILEISKTIMYDFYYNVLKKYYGPNVQHLYGDTDSIICSILTEDLYKDLLDPLLNDHFDLSNYPPDHPCYSVKNKNVLGKFKDELAGKILLKFVGLRAKMYALLYELIEVLKAKGVNSAAVRRGLIFNDFFDCLQYHVPKDLTFHTIRSENHVIHTLQQTKKALDHRDDKRYICQDGITTLAHGHVLLELGDC